MSDRSSKYCRCLVRFVCVIVLFVGSASADGPSSWPAAFVFVDQVPLGLQTETGRAVTVLDARDRRAYRRGHIPGAQHAPWTRYRDGWFRSGRLPDNLVKLAEDLSKLGVDDRRPVLVCGEAREGWGEEGRIAWMLSYLGHADVAVLDGGCAAWRDADRPFTKDVEPPSGATFTLRPQEQLRASKPDVVAAIEDASVQLLDVRTREEFAGATPFFESRGGHIPTAKNIPFAEFFDAGGYLKRSPALEQMLAGAGVIRERPVVIYCTGGVRSAFVAEVLRDIGVDSANYDASFWEWSADRSLPVSLIHD